ncbi:MAG: hypothetical protein V3U92_02165 [Cellulophaga sp.]
MVEVFITDIKEQALAKKIVKALEYVFSELDINYDMDETGLPFPQGHTVLRVEGENIDAGQIILIVKKSGLNCEIMEDNITE